jgi:hypothetical protein
MTPLDVAAVSMHELYESFRRAGFTRSEAITIIAKTAAEIVAQQVAEQSEKGDGDGHPQ